jgi:hypothetical protein
MNGQAFREAASRLFEFEGFHAFMVSPGPGPVRVRMPG